MTTKKQANGNGGIAGAGDCAGDGAVGGAAASAGADGGSVAGFAAGAGDGSGGGADLAVVMSETAEMVAMAVAPLLLDDRRRKGDFSQSTQVAHEAPASKTHFCFPLLMELNYGIETEDSQLFRCACGKVTSQENDRSRHSDAHIFLTSRPGRR